MTNTHEPKNANAVLQGGPFDGDKVAATLMPGVELAQQDAQGVRHRYVQTTDVAGDPPLAVLLYAGVAEG